MSEPNVTVMVVDDQSMWRDGVARDLEERGFEVRATTGDAVSALRIARTGKPDGVLMALNLGDTSGVEASRQITQEIPGTQVLVLSASGAHDDVLEAVKAGASGIWSSPPPWRSWWMRCKARRPATRCSR